jgi:hypothetical protein
MFLLFDRRGAHINLDADPAACPTIASVEQLASPLREGQERLRTLPIDDIIGLFDAAARSWTEPGHPVGRMLRERSLGFLVLWFRRQNLESLCDVALHGNRQALDVFVPAMAGSTRLHRAHPRGLLVHWLAGNVPLLGMISVAQGLLAKNANLVKASRQNAGVLPFLLAALRCVRFTGSSRGVIEGSLLTDSVTVVYADREDVQSARALSLLADVRVAWGGREAVETIGNLPRRLGAEDIIFGPKTSFAVVGADALADEVAAKQTAQRLAHDTIALDQRGCNSPHTVFVERGGVVTPQAFASLVAQELLLLANHLPPPSITVPEAFEILTRRAEYEMRGEAWDGEGVTWSVLYAEEEGLAVPCFGRTLSVRPVDDVFDVVRLCSAATQTAGLALTARRIALAEALTARGVERCPELGSMALYDTPWDGMYPIDRLVRWVSAL